MGYTTFSDKVTYLLVIPTPLFISHSIWSSGQEYQLEFAMGFRFHRTGIELAEGVAPLLTSRDPHLAGGEATI